MSYRHRSGSFSQPRTPGGGASGSSGLALSSSFHALPSATPGGRGGGPRTRGATGSLGSTTPGGAPGGGGGGGRTVREMEESARELKKENFNLKLRIYFLEERLGATSAGSRPGSKEEMQLANSNLKVGEDSDFYVYLASFSIS